MRRLKAVGLALMSMLVLGLTATSALAALPDLHSLLGAKLYPITALGESASAETELGNASGAVLTGKGVELSLEFTELSALGLYTVTFKNVKKGTKTCKTGADAAGTVKIEKEGVHLVFVSLAPALKVGVLYLVLNPVTITCGTLKVKVEGSVLGSFLSAENTVINSISGDLMGELGNQLLTKYWNSAETAQLTAELLSDAGDGFVKSNEQVEGAVTVLTEGKANG